MTKQKEQMLEQPAEPGAGSHTHDITMTEISVVDLEQLRARCAATEAERDRLAARVAEMELRLNPPPEIARPRSCINCGQRAVPIGWDGEVFSCPVCKHAWPPADEMAPFRQGR